MWRVIVAVLALAYIGSVLRGVDPQWVGGMAVGLVALYVWMMRRKVGTATTTAVTGIPPEVLLKAHRQMIETLAGQDNSASLPGCPIVLQRGERLSFATGGVRLCEERAVRSRSAGYSFRVMRGLWLRSSSAHTTRQVTQVDQGWLALTNKRFVFVGSVKSLEFPLNKLTMLESSEDGVALGKSGRERLSYFMGLNHVQATLTVTHEGKTSSIPHSLNGMDVRELVDYIQNPPADTEQSVERR